MVTTHPCYLALGKWTSASCREAIPVFNGKSIPLVIVIVGGNHPQDLTLEGGSAYCPSPGMNTTIQLHSSKLLLDPHCYKAPEFPSRL